MPDAFYLPAGENRFRPTEHTSGPWSADAQHFGPPSALLTRAMERLSGQRAAMLARVTVEILGPAPLTELTVDARVERPGRSVELLTAEMRAAERIVARGSAWRLATSDSTHVAAGAAAPLPTVDEADEATWPAGWRSGYLTAMEWRTAAGSVDEPGPATVWVRQRVPLVPDEEPSGTQRLLAVADSGNGASSRLDPERWWFINSELTVHTHRVPGGEWIGLDADTVIGSDGVGTASSTLHDVHGPVGNGAQALLVRRR